MQKVEPRTIFLDSASTTPLHEEVMKSADHLMKEKFYNTEALYDSARELSGMMEKSRQAIAKQFNIFPEEVIFTSGATEANNLAIKGLAFQNPGKKHLITTEVEHSSVFNAFKQLEEVFGYEVTCLPVNQSGEVLLEDLKSAVRTDTLLISIMMVNNEVGTIQPVSSIKQWVKKETNAYLHVDAVQALGKIDIDCSDIDLMSFSAHKIEGFKGSGLLIKKKHVELLPLLSGGQQELGVRGGTSNAMVNILFAKTLRLAIENQHKYHGKLREMKLFLIDELNRVEGILINTPLESVDNIVNFSYPNIPSEVMMNALNQRGIEVSAQSTCSSKRGNSSRVLKAMGFDKKRVESCIRVSFSYRTKKEELIQLLEAIKEICKCYGNL